MKHDKILQYHSHVVIILIILNGHYISIISSTMVFYSNLLIYSNMEEAILMYKHKHNSYCKRDIILKPIKRKIKQNENKRIRSILNPPKRK